MSDEMLEHMLCYTFTIMINGVKKKVIYRTIKAIPLNAIMTDWSHSKVSLNPVVIFVGDEWKEIAHPMVLNLSEWTINDGESCGESVRNPLTPLKPKTPLRTFVSPPKVMTNQETSTCDIKPVKEEIKSCCQVL